MARLIGVIGVLALLLLFSISAECAAKALSREQVDQQWEAFLREENYWAIQFLNPKLEAPTLDRATDDRTIHVSDAREGLLWGFFGLSDGGGWQIEGRLEDEVRTDQGILHLYSKATTKWFPGFWWILMPWYDLDKWPQWEFRLVLRNPGDRRKIRVLKSVQVPPQEVIHPNPRGLRTPRGSLQYDRARRLAIMEILGVHHPVRLEVPEGF